MTQTLASCESSISVNIYITLWVMRCDMFQSLYSQSTLWVLGDASFAPTGETSQQGVVVYHGTTSNQRKGGNLVQWRSSRQDLVAKSTCEAELIASSEALQQGENISIVISEMINASCDIEVSSDNAAALHMVRNAIWIRDSVENPSHQHQSTMVASDVQERNHVHI